MSDSEDWDLPDLDSLMRGEKKHEWLSEPRFEKMFSEIEDGLQGVLGKGTYDWVDRRVFDAVFDKSTISGSTPFRDRYNDCVFVYLITTLAFSS